jgi:very-short-patch-repair endonuclease
MAARDPTRSPFLRARAQDLRRDATEAERTLWRYLQRSQLGEKFRRQHRIDRYIVDFYCVKRSLAIELDGGQHFTDEEREKDALRTDVLGRYGVRVVRFSNREAMNETRTVVEEIRRLLEGGSSGDPTPRPSPHQGRGSAF